MDWPEKNILAVPFGFQGCVVVPDTVQSYQCPPDYALARKFEHVFFTQCFPDGIFRGIGVEILLAVSSLRNDVQVIEALGIGSLVIFQFGCHHDGLSVTIVNHVCVTDHTAAAEISYVFVRPCDDAVIDQLILAIFAFAEIRADSFVSVYIPAFAEVVQEIVTIVQPLGASDRHGIALELFFTPGVAKVK